jgi:hypothetical protein
MNVETGIEAGQFPEKEYINGIFLAVWISLTCLLLFHYFLAVLFTIVAVCNLARKFLLTFVRFAHNRPLFSLLYLTPNYQQSNQKIQHCALMKNKIKIFLVYKEIQIGSGAKSRAS